MTVSVFTTRVKKTNAFAIAATWAKATTLAGLFLASASPAKADVTAESSIKVNAALDRNEQTLLGGFELLQQHSFTEAVNNIQGLTQDQPTYKLAQLMKADLYAIKAGHSQWIEHYRRIHPKESQALLSEARLRWQQAAAMEPGLTDPLLQNYVLKSSNQPYLIIVNTQAHRLYLYKHTPDGYQSITNYYVSIGQKGVGKEVRGDRKTPIGVYYVVKELADKDLPELYGVAALTLNYPNQWDRQNGRTGSGIWLHGTPRNTFSRPPLASRGCVVLNNPAMTTLIQQYRLTPETPVIIVDKTVSTDVVDLQANEKRQVLTRINEWLRFQAPYQVDWSQVSVYQYPGEQSLYYVRFPVQEAKGTRWVEQYWRSEPRNKGQWVLETQNERLINVS